MKTTIPKLRRMIRKVITETSDNLGPDGTPEPPNLVEDMIFFIDEELGMEGFAYDEYAIRKRLKDEFPDASEEQITTALERT